ncbi:MAG: hypothetical protein BGO01_13005 [Armatimonadetes bacterium 55-13]|nr:DUF2330 domain-containing protein [Armatimonadota bacterium]OJU61828.1 MAG: hypothetical protein BGO01_13005 [Armatimonadetes bacterium 55-13]
MASRRYLYLAAWVCVAICVPDANACCTAYGAGSKVTMVGESVIIVWDAKNKVEHFIRKASFDATGKDFGFIVPTPSVPTFGIADPAAFQQLESLVPRPPTDSMALPKGVASSRAGSVQILKTERVGDYQATVVKATDGATMNAWLKENHYASRPAMTDWLDSYTKKQWVFTALKYVAEPNRTTQTKALRLSFKTETPHYPYKMPRDTWPSGWRRNLTVYFVSNAAMVGAYEGTDRVWEANQAWSGALPESMRSPLAKNLDLSANDIPTNAKVTIFRNGENPDGYDQDLVFAEMKTNWTPWLGGLAVFGLGILAFKGRKIKQ